MVGGQSKKDKHKHTESDQMPEMSMLKVGAFMPLLCFVDTTRFLKLLTGFQFSR